eukprot:TRINITY_DN7444_c0_g2_i1.p1 TRINITY_DN7444_c0_g2~~TRINITY_DN7444_c0_g2_i1.p1  ORF type:complete len:112 (-),score=25.96 TRINITY_DN7444_c0_g2_i1:21-356(-)
MMLNYIHKTTDQIGVWDCRTKENVLNLSYNSSKSSNLIKPSWSPDGFLVASGSTESKVHLWDIRYANSKPAYSLTLREDKPIKVTATEFHPFEKIIFSLSADRMLTAHPFN